MIMDLKDFHFEKRDVQVLVEPEIRLYHETRPITTRLSRPSLDFVDSERIEKIRNHQGLGEPVVIASDNIRVT